ncbi:hypothetical protein TBS_03300 [Thermobispora bispora]
MVRRPESPAAPGRPAEWAVGHREEAAVPGRPADRRQDDDSTAPRASGSSTPQLMNSSVSSAGDLS